MNTSALTLAATRGVSIDLPPVKIRRFVAVDSAAARAVVALVTRDIAVREVQHPSACDHAAAGLSAGGVPCPTGDGHTADRDRVGRDLYDGPVIAGASADDRGLPAGALDGHWGPDHEATVIGPRAYLDNLAAGGGYERSGDCCIRAATGADGHGSPCGL